jgi:hypothetical protein
MAWLLSRPLRLGLLFVRSIEVNIMSWMSLLYDNFVFYFKITIKIILKWNSFEVFLCGTMPLSLYI